ncbi:neutral zinc metallopeptidase [Saccharopolyspora sp. K220]|uniref:neutral zinc metallopeptidase n=1 Tax=Saccharopolyspora soli TaxID=2926618 RepID=UPI001F598765|nr:neutral zinc metallopeptidase [Saccharopolyspora soli]MCI2417772.1 neutral zinc metallopeptidase [Saccharopolyspora soli]
MARPLPQQTTMRLSTIPPVQAPPQQLPPQLPPMGPPQRKGSGGVVVALVLVAVALFGVGTIGALAASVSSSSASDYDTSTAETTSSAESSDTATSSTETSSTEEETTSADSTDGEPEPVASLGDNPINISGNGAMNTQCDLPSFDTDVASQDNFYQAALPCLMQAWTPALQAAGLPVETPSVITTGDSIDSPCGTRMWNQTAMYCPGNHTIYMTARYYSEVENRTDAGAYLGQFAHEFGHALQGMTGISIAYGDASYDAGGSTTSAGLELTRRSELQATCFEGMSLAALQNGGVSNDYIFPALEDSSGRGDENSNVPDHGSKATNRAWIEQGFTKNRVTECNTWLAAPSDVD